MTRNPKRIWLVLSAVIAAGAYAEKPDRDDPRGRLMQRKLDEGSRSPEDRLEIIEIARREGLKWSVANTDGRRQPVRAGGSAWVNLGPRSANFEKNGVTFNKVDSGRLRNILVHPTNPDIVYVATSGGGVWKTFDATAVIDTTSGPHWHPITEALGSLSIGALAMSPFNPDILLLGLGDPFDVQTPGFFSSQDGGATWSGPALLSGTYPGFAGTFTAASVRDIAFSGSAQVVLAATDIGLFRSVESGLGSGWQLIDVDIAHHPQEFWSLGRVGGQVWLATSIDLMNQLGRVWRSVDDGASWQRVTSFNPIADLDDVRRMTLAVSATDTATPNAARVYLLAENSASTAQKDVFRSDDGGQSWNALGVNSTGAPANPNDDQFDLDVMHEQAFYNHMIVVDPQNHDRVLLGGNLSLVRSLDGGRSWAVMGHWLPGTVTINGAPAPMPEYTYVHADHHAAAISYGSGSLVFYAGTDGGIFRSTDVFTAAPGDAHFEDRMNRGIVSHLIYSVATGNERADTLECHVPDTTLDVVYGGFQDDGTRLRVLPAAGDPTVFNQIVGGDGFGVGIGCASTGGQVASLLINTLPSRLQRSVDGGGTFAAAMTGIGITLDPSFTFNMKLSADLTDPNGRTFLTPLTEATTRVGHVFRTTNGGGSWSSINGTIHCANSRPECTTTATVIPLPLRNITTHPRTAGHYAVASVTRAYVSADAGLNWDETVRVYPDASGACVQPSSIAFDPNDPTGNTVWVASKSTRTSDSCAGPGQPISAAVGHLFKSTNAHSLGTSTWLAVHGSGASALPNVPINVVKVDPGDSQTIYAATEIGLYRSIDGGASWARYGTGLPLVSVTDLSIAHDGSSVRVSTFGRGFWEIYPKAGGSPAGVAGNGDFNFDQVIDGTDLVREAAALLSTNGDAEYNAIGNLTGTTNAIDDTDLTALVAKLGGRP